MTTFPFLLVYRATYGYRGSGLVGPVFFVMMKNSVFFGLYLYPIKTISMFVFGVFVSKTKYTKR